MKFKISGVSNPHDSERPIKAPEIKVQLLGDNGAMLDDSIALIDSGANDTMVNKDYALELGIDLSGVKGYDISGIGNCAVHAKPVSRNTGPGTFLDVLEYGLEASVRLFSEV